MARKRNPARLVIALSVAAVLAVFLLYTSIAGGGTPSVAPSELAGKTGVVTLVGKVTAYKGDSYGDGLRCVGGALKRLYSRSASGGAAQAPQGGDPSITARSAALGDPIAPGSSRYYMTYYRDANPGFCPNPPGNTFNASNSLSILW